MLDATLFLGTRNKTPVTISKNHANEIFTHATTSTWSEHSCIIRRPINVKKHIRPGSNSGSRSKNPKSASSSTLDLSPKCTFSHTKNNDNMNVQPVRKAIIAGLTGVGSFVFAYNISKTWSAQALSPRKNTDLGAIGKQTLGYDLSLPNLIHLMKDTSSKLITILSRNAKIEG